MTHVIQRKYTRLPNGALFNNETGIIKPLSWGWVKDQKEILCSRMTHGTLDPDGIYQHPTFGKANDLMGYRPDVVWVDQNTRLARVNVDGVVGLVLLVSDGRAYHLSTYSAVIREQYPDAFRYFRLEA